jgi:dipeptidyl aminopeptidase/acylaminoacyl peptidase
MTFFLRPRWNGPIFLAGLVGLFTSNTCLAKQSSEQEGTRHPISVAETLAIRRVSEPQISPDGTRVAYVVTQPIKETNQYHAVLYVADAGHAGSVLTLAEGFHIATVRWSSDAKRIFFVREDENGRNIWEAPSSGGPAKRLTDIQGELVHVSEFSLPVDPYQVSAGGTMLFYATYDTATARREFEEKTRGGRLYEGEGYWRVVTTKFQSAPYQLWERNLQSGHVQKIWQTPTFQPPGNMAPEFQLSKDGRKVALLYQTTEWHGHALALLDVGTQKPEILVADLGHSFSLKWSDDQQSLLFTSQGRVDPAQATRPELRQYAYSLSRKNLKPVEGAAANSMSSADAFSAEVEKQTSRFVHHCSFDSRKTLAACIEEASALAPEVVEVPLKACELAGKPITLTHLNPELDSVEFGQISSLRWSEKGSEEGDADAGLVLPAGYVPGKRYPLLVMLYNMYDGKHFVAEGAEFNSYAVQAFAGHGYAVLLVDVPADAFVYKEGDFAAAKAGEVDSMVSAVRTAVDLVAARGIADPKRMGIMGWSYGAFWTDYIMTHYPEWFQAAASGEGDNHNPALYWLGGNVYKRQEDNFFGGGPYGKYWERWKEVAPALNVDRLRGPLLLETSTSILLAMEMREAILTQGGQTELYYTDDEHVFQQPVNRFNSMMRHFDWFNFWLLGEEDPDPGKVEQYKRWRGLRELQTKNGKKSSSARPASH